MKQRQQSLGDRVMQQTRTTGQRGVAGYAEEMIDRSSDAERKKKKKKKRGRVRRR